MLNLNTKNTCFLLFFLLYYSIGISHAGTVDKINAFLGNEHTLKYSWYGFFALSNACDGAKDGYYWSTIGGEETFHVTEPNWHIPKNIGRISFVLSGAALFSAKAKGHISWKQLFGRFVAGCFISYPLWRSSYTKVRWNTVWNTTAEHNEHIITYPNIRTMQDEYIGLSGWEVSAFLGGMGATGLTLMFIF